MRQGLRFIRIDVTEEIAVAPTLTDADDLARVKAQASLRARELAWRL